MSQISPFPTSYNAINSPFSLKSNTNTSLDLDYYLTPHSDDFKSKARGPLNFSFGLRKNTDDDLKKPKPEFIEIEDRSPDKTSTQDTCSPKQDAKSEKLEKPKLMQITTKDGVETVNYQSIIQQKGMEQIHWMLVQRAYQDYQRYFNDCMHNLLNLVNRDYEEEARKAQIEEMRLARENSLRPDYLEDYQEPFRSENRHTPIQQKVEVLSSSVKKENSSLKKKKKFEKMEKREDSIPFKELKIVPKVKKTRKIKKRSVQCENRIKSQSEVLKNITKNYGKACSKFASGPIGLPFLMEFITDEEEIKEFQEYIKSNAEHIKNIPFFRNCLHVGPTDPPKIAKFKTIFKTLCELFVSRYASKWIYTSSQLLNRKGHLSYRRKMLRRIQDPENFFGLNH
jgi:hypothetical protein